MTDFGPESRNNPGMDIISGQESMKSYRFHVLSVQSAPQDYSSRVSVMHFTSCGSICTSRTRVPSSPQSR